MSLIRVFQVVLKDAEEKIPPSGGGMGNLLGMDFLSGVGHLRRSGFDHSSLFQSRKHSVNIDHQLKSKLA